MTAHAMSMPAPARAAAPAALHWPSFRAAVAPFAAAPLDRLLERRIAGRVALPLLVVAAVLPWWPRPQPVHPPTPPVPLARLLLEPLAPPPPPPAAVRPAPAPTPAPVPEAVRSAGVVPEARRPLPQRRAGERDPAQPRADGMGLLALKQQLAQIHGAPAAVQVTAPERPGRGIGSGQGVGVGVGAGSEAGVPLRALVSAQGGAGSAGLGLAAASHDSGGGGLPGRATTLVAGVTGGRGGGGAGGGGVGAPGIGTAGAAAGGAGGAAQKPAQRARRSIEDIRLVFDRHKGAIHALYNRALRDEPALQGKVVLELRIAPGGQVLDCRIVASELKAPELERRLVARVRQFDFGAQDVDPLVVTWPVDFLPG